MKIENTVEFAFGGQAFLALPQRGLYWPEEDALIVADTHLGKDDVFRRQGVPVPVGTDLDTLLALGRLIDLCGTRKLWILGDFLHGEVDEDGSVVGIFNEWRARRENLSVVVARGNHDRHQNNLSCWEGVEWVRELVVQGLRLRHDPNDERGGFVVGGHLHPVYRLRDGRRSSERVPVFWIRDRMLVLPAFSEFTGGFRIELGRGDRAIAALATGAVWLKRTL